MSAHAPRIAAALRGVREALDAERSALIGNDAEALPRIAADKSAGMRQLVVLFQDAGGIGAHADAVRELSELNVANGALLARRRRETQWVLDQLGLCERRHAYDAGGRVDGAAKGRWAATA